MSTLRFFPLSLVALSLATSSALICACSDDEDPALSESDAQDVGMTSDSGVNSGDTTQVAQSVSLTRCSDGEEWDWTELRGNVAAVWAIGAHGWCSTRSRYVREIREDAEARAEDVRLVVLYAASRNFDEPSLSECVDWAETQGVSPEWTFIDWDGEEFGDSSAGVTWELPNGGLRPRQLVVDGGSFEVVFNADGPDRTVLMTIDELVNP